MGRKIGDHIIIIASIAYLLAHTNILVSRLCGLLSATEWPLLFLSARSYERRTSRVLASEKHILRGTLRIFNRYNVAIGAKAAGVYHILYTISLIFNACIELLPGC